MAEDKIEVMRRAVAAASGRDAGSTQVIDAHDPAAREAFFEFLDPEIEVHEDQKFPEAGVYRGIDAVRGYLEQFTEQFEEFRMEVEDLVDAGGDDVLFLYRLRGRGKGSGAPVDEKPGWLYTIRGGKAVRIRLYLDRAEAFEAAGLPPA